MYIYILPIYTSISQGRSKQAITNETKKKISSFVLCLGIPNIMPYVYHKFDHFSHLIKFLNSISCSSHPNYSNICLIGSDLKTLCHQIIYSDQYYGKKLVYDVLYSFNWFDLSVAYWYFEERRPGVPENLLKKKYEKLLRACELVKNIPCPKNLLYKPLETNTNSSILYKTPITNLQYFMQLFKLDYQFENLKWLHKKTFLLIEMLHLKYLFKMESYGVPFDKKLASKLIVDWRSYKYELEKDLDKFAVDLSSRKLGDDYQFSIPLNLDEVSTVQHLIAAVGNDLDVLVTDNSEEEPPKTKKRRTTTSNCRICPKTCKIPKFSTAAENLENIIEKLDKNFDSEQTEIIQKVIDWRKLKRRIGELETLQKFAVKEDQNDETSSSIYRIPYTSSFTETGRILMENPNLLTISNAFEYKNESICPRKVIGVNYHSTKSKNLKLLSLDFKQIEQRTIAHLSNDSNLINLLNQPTDFFENVAKQIFGKTNYSSEKRKQIKAMVYGLNYGMGNKSLSGRLKIEESEAAKIKNKYFSLFKKMADFREGQKMTSQIESILGRVRHFPKNAESNGKQFTTVIATIVQSAASDIVRILTITVNRLIDKKYNEKEIRLVLQIHDELLIEIEEERAKKFVKEVRLKMRQKLVELIPDLKIEFPIRAQIGPNYGELEDFC